MTKEPKHPLEITTNLSIEELQELFNFFEFKPLDRRRIEVEDLTGRDIVSNTFEHYSVNTREKTINVYDQSAVFDLYINNTSDITCKFNRYILDDGDIRNRFEITVTTDIFKCLLTFSYIKYRKVKSGIKILKEAKERREANR